MTTSFGYKLIFKLEITTYKVYSAVSLIHVLLSHKTCLFVLTSSSLDHLTVIRKYMMRFCPLDSS